MQSNINIVAAARQTVTGVWDLFQNPIFVVMSLIMMYVFPVPATYVLVAGFSALVFKGKHYKEAPILDGTQKLKGTAILVAFVLSLGVSVLFDEINPIIKPIITLIAVVSSITFGLSHWIGTIARYFDKRIEGNIIKEIGLDSDTKSEFGSQMVKLMDEVFENHPDPMLAGDTLRAGYLRYPYAKFKSLYYKIREDMRRPMHTLGWLITGERISELASFRFNEDTVIKVFDSILKKQRVTFNFGFNIVVAVLFSVALFLCFNSITSVIANPGSLFQSSPVKGKTAQLADGEKPSADDAIFNTRAENAQIAQEAAQKRFAANAYHNGAQGYVADPAVQRDYWDQADGKLAAADVPKADIPTHWLAEFLSKYTPKLFGLIAMFVACYVWVARSYVRTAKDLLSTTQANAAINEIVNTDTALLTPTAQSESVYFYEKDNTIGEHHAYCESIAEAQNDRTAFIPLMLGEPTALARGIRNSWSTDQVVGMTLDNMRQNVFVLGGTGQGKTFSVLLPAIRQTLVHAVADEINGEKRNYKFSLLVTDGGGTLQADCIKLGKELEYLGYTVRSIGLGENDQGMDLYDKLSPIDIQSMFEQAGAKLGHGAGNDPFWHNSACYINLCCLTLLQPYELTKHGRERAKRLGERVYSPIGTEYFFNSVRRKDGLVMEAIEALLETLNGDDEETIAAIAPMLSPDFWSKIEYLSHGAFIVPDQTFESFRAHGQLLLQTFNYSPTFRARFGCSSSTGGVTEIMNVDSLWDDRSINAVMFNSAIDGVMAVVGNTFVMTRAILRRTQMSILDNKIGNKSLTMTISDENQLDIAAGQSAAPSSLPSFLNRARKTGMFFWCASQDISSLYKAMGETMNGQETESYLAQFRHKIFLGGDNAATSAYMTENAETTTRFHSVSNSDTYYGARLMRGEDGSQDITPYILDENDIDCLVESTISMKNCIIKARLRDAVPYENHLHDAQYTGGQDGQGGSIGTPGKMGAPSAPSSAPVTEWVAIKKDLERRQQDQTHKLFTEGMQKVPVVTGQDLKLRGRGTVWVSFLIGSHVKTGFCRTMPELGSAKSDLLPYSLNALPEFVKQDLIRSGELKQIVDARKAKVAHMRSSAAITSTQKVELIAE